MVDIKFSPPREGTRGGREQFKWEDLKSHNLKDREHYLGHSVKVGLLERKNKFYKHDWYLRKESPDHSDGNGTGQKLDERELTRRFEEEIMEEMLGNKPKKLMLLKSRPTDLRELERLLNNRSKDESVREEFRNGNHRGDADHDYGHRSSRYNHKPYHSDYHHGYDNNGPKYTPKYRERTTRSSNNELFTNRSTRGNRYGERYYGYRKPNSDDRHIKQGIRYEYRYDQRVLHRTERGERELPYRRDHATRVHQLRRSRSRDTRIGQPRPRELRNRELGGRPIDRDEYVESDRRRRDRSPYPRRPRAPVDARPYKRPYRS